MDSQTYWKNREAEQRKHNIRDEAEYQKRIQEIYQNMIDEIEKEINGFYGKYAKKEGITMAEARKRAAKADIEALGRKAKRYVKDKDFSDQANEEMRLYNMTMKVNRLELLKAQIGLEMVAGFDEMEKYFGEILTDRAVSEFKRQAGILGKTIQNNAKAVNAIVNASFHNATFSDRIWMYQDMLKNELNSLLQTGLIQGQSSRKLAIHLRKRFGVSQSNAERLMTTELRRVQTEVAKQSYETNGNSEYKFLAINPMGACAKCKAIDGKKFKVKDMMPGTNAPPMHPRCHCATAPYWDEEIFEAWLEADTDLEFAEWSRLRERSVFEPEILINTKALNKKQRSRLESELNLIPKQHLEIIKNSINGIRIDENGNSRYNSIEKIVYLSNDLEEGEAIHELAHVLERSLNIYGNEEFVDILRDGLGKFDFSSIDYIPDKYEKAIFVLKSPKFVSEYQGRLYEEVGFQKNDGQWNPYSLAEYFAEGYKEYILNPQKLKNKDKKLYDYIEGLV